MGANVQSLYGKGSTKIDAALAGGNISWLPSAEQPVSLYIETGGDVSFVGIDGKADVWTVPDGTYINIAMQQVVAATTTATGIHAIFG